MGPLVLWASVAVAAAVAGAVTLYLILAWLLGVPPHPETATADQQRLLADMVKIALGLAAGIGAAVALMVGYRRARVEESASHRDDSRLFSSRYQDAADLLGHDKAAVRLAGVYAMSRLADDWDEQRQQCIDVLCAYMRLPYDPDDTSKPGEQQVRATVIRVITAHLQSTARVSWQGHDLDFTGAVFDGGDFLGAVFSGGTVHFGDAVFSGGDVHFRNAKFSGGTVDFSNAEFSGSDVVFYQAEFSGGYVNFYQAVFSGGTVYLSEAKFSGCTVHFGEAVFSGGDVHFSNAKFSGGDVNFYQAVFSGGVVDFGEAEFSGGTVYFSNAKFSGGDVDFYQAVFSGGVVDFGEAEFSGGTVNFSGAEFSGGDLDFGDAEFSGGEVDLSATALRSGGTAPQGLPEAQIPSLKLPGWMKQTSPGRLPPH